VVRMMEEGGRKKEEGRRKKAGWPLSVVTVA
jgi:hypothetical protein